jgi:hypothetical protein
VDKRVPNSWVIRTATNGFFSLAPESWQQDNFWDLLYEDYADAMRIFDYERKRLME